MTAEQLRTNQRISIAAVKRSNQSLDLLDPILRQPKIPNKVLGWRSQDLRDGAVTGAKIANGSVAEADLASALAARLPAWAVVNSNGTLARSSGGITSQRTGPGLYRVDLNRTVGTCAWTGTQVETTAADLGPVGIELDPVDPQRLLVATADDAGGRRPGLRPPGDLLSGSSPATPQRGVGEDPLHHVVEAQPGLGGLRQQARVGEARDGVDLEDPEPVLGVQQHVDAAQAAAAEHAEALQGQARRLLGHGLGEAGGGLEVGQAGRVARLEVVEVAIARDRLHHRERPRLGRADHRDGQLAPLDEPLDEHAVVVGQGAHQGARDVGRRARHRDAERRALLGGLDHQRQAQPLPDLGIASPAPSSRKASWLKA